MDGEFISDGYYQFIFNSSSNPFIVNTSNKSFIRFDSNYIGVVDVDLSDGTAVGQMLILTVVANSNPIKITAFAGENINLTGANTNWEMHHQDTLVLLWDGTKWIEITRSDN